jgi:hypothetical protein
MPQTPPEGPGVPEAEALVDKVLDRRRRERIERFRAWSFWCFGLVTTATTLVNSCGVSP